MSGIAAILTRRGDRPRQCDLDRLTSSLSRYGGDRTDLLQRGPVVLAHCLQRFTTQDAYDRQPLNIQNRYSMVFDGRIDNRAELAEQLSIPDRELPMRADSALAAMAFSRWADDAWNRLVGVFAILIYDGLEGDLRCVRDQLGLRVLHYQRQRERFLIASSPHVLFTQQGVACELNEARLAEHLVYAGLDSHETFYSGIHRVRPGHWLRVSASDVCERRYWSSLDAPDIRHRRDGEYVEQFQDIFCNVVRQQLRSKTAVAATLTGGLDASSISATAARLLQSDNAPLHTFTHVPVEGFEREPTRYEYFDETERVQAIADMHTNMRPTLVSTPYQAPGRRFGELTGLYRMPVSGPINAIWSYEIFEQVRRRGMNALLVGEAGNMTFSASGYHLFPELIRRLSILRLLRELRAFPAARRRLLIRKWVLSPFLPSWIYQSRKRRRSGLDNYWAYYGAVHPDFSQEIDLDGRLASDSYDIYHQPTRNGKRWRAEALRSYVDTACYWQEVRAVHGVDTRAPALDRRIVEFCQGIPESQFLRNGVSRWLIRRAMAGDLPRIVLETDLRGSQAAGWLQACIRSKGELSQIVAALTRDPELSRMLDLSALERIVEAVPEGPSADILRAPTDLRYHLPVALSAARFVRDTRQRNR